MSFLKEVDLNVKVRVPIGAVPENVAVEVQEYLNQKYEGSTALLEPWDALPKLNGMVDIRATTSEDLHKYLEVKDLTRVAGKEINPSWLRARIAEELYNRNEIDEVSLDFHMR